MGREEQIERLRFCITPAIRGQKPMHVWLYGGPGTGKTVVARHVLRLLQAEAQIKGSYINCWQHSTFYSVLEKIINDLRLLMAEKVSTPFKLEALQKKLEKCPYVVILDEIDQPSPKERATILYNLCGLESVGLVCICNTRRTLFDMEERIKSRLCPVQIEFPTYSQQHMVEILKDRARLALNGNAWREALADSIASLADGDARVAIHTLRDATRHAEAEQSDCLKEEHILKGHNSAKNLRKTYLLDRLSEDHRVLFGIIEEQKEIESGTLWHNYLLRCLKINRQPIAMRTFSQYMNRMAELNLVRIDRAPVKGNVRLFRVLQ